MKVRHFGLVLVVLLAMGALQCAAQSVDAFVGVNWLGAGTNNSGALPATSTGVFPSLGADLMLPGGFGIGGEVAWRSTSISGSGQQPAFWDVNLIDHPFSLIKIVPEIQAGVGGEFKAPANTCNALSPSTCVNSPFGNGFLVHLGAGVKVYIVGNVFLRPEAHVYFVHNNNTFASGPVKRFGVSLGYTFRAL